MVGEEEEVQSRLLVNVFEELHQLKGQHVLPAVVADLEDGRFPRRLAAGDMCRRFLLAGAVFASSARVESDFFHLVDAKMADLKGGQVGSLGSALERLPAATVNVQDQRVRIGWQVTTLWGENQSPSIW